MPRFIVYGAGAVGGSIGSRLFEHGHDVVLIARGAHREAIARAGLRFESPDGVLVQPIEVVALPEEIAWRDDDVVLLTVKSQDTAGVLERLEAAAGPDVAVACVQNGVENERAALRRFAARVLGGRAAARRRIWSPAWWSRTPRRSPVRSTSAAIPTGVDDRAREIAEVFAGERLRLAAASRHLALEIREVPAQRHERRRCPVRSRRRPPRSRGAPSPRPSPRSPPPGSTTSTTRSTTSATAA